MATRDQVSGKLGVFLTKFDTDKEVEMSDDGLEVCTRRNLLAGTALFAPGGVVRSLGGTGLP